LTIFCRPDGNRSQYEYTLFAKTCGGALLSAATSTPARAQQFLPEPDITYFGDVPYCLEPRFGLARRPAALNYGDCFSYALAKVGAEPLLFKASDFSRTDLAAATAT
jgi:hypothetical protein